MVCSASVVLENDALLAAVSTVNDEEEEEGKEEEAATAALAGGDPTIIGCDSGANTWVLPRPMVKKERIIGGVKNRAVKYSCHSFVQTW